MIQTERNTIRRIRPIFANKQYPFIRDVYTINRETFAGLGTGFTSFVAGDAGQRIILKMGMLPATLPIRLIKIKSK